MGVILFSYRPTDSKTLAERILERLKYNYGDEVRGDVRTPRDDIRSYIDGLLERDSVLVVVIGPGWLDSRSRQGSRQLDDPLDYVRVEVAVALAKNRPVIPVLVSGAKMPESDELPDDIERLSNVPPLVFGAADDFRGGMMKLHRLLAKERAPLVTRQTPAIPSDAIPPDSRKDYLNDLAQERLKADKHPFEGVEIGTLGEVRWILGAQAGALGKNYGARKFAPDLTGADLSNVNLSGADLSGAKLADAKLVQANLDGVNLTQAVLAGADLTEATLVGARLAHAQMHAATLRLANLSGCSLEGADLSDVDLTTTGLSRALLNGATLQRAVLTQQRLPGVQLKQADLREANLVDTDLSGAQLEAANLNGARLDDANLSNASLMGADLSHAKLVRTDLSDVNLSAAIIQSVDDLRRVIIAGDPQFRKVRWGDRPVKDPRGISDRTERLRAYRVAAQIYHDLAEMLRHQGLIAEASVYRLEEQRMRRGVLRSSGRVGQWLFSSLLNVISGYGERVGRTLVTYLGVIVMFAVAYFVGSNYLSIGTSHLSLYEAFLQSVAAFHGRGFVTSALQLGDPMAGVTLAESVTGLFIEAIFIATFSRRFLGD